ncbi:MAG: tRNA (adenosine(37)-N6)-threonylcarbamoyltransferase complex ATPase subunit type 1 TsaE [Minisyncoccales bacterium]
MVKSYLTKNAKATQKLAQTLARKILKQKKEKTLIIGLIGELGSGKTTFCQGFARALGVKEKILSPTFIILKRFSIHNPSSKFINFYHLDCYRIGKPKEILRLGFKNIISQPRNIIVIEWADRIRKILPRQTIILQFDFIDKNLRKITLNSQFMLK